MAAEKMEMVREGDWLEARGLPGQASRRGQIVALLGREGHQHYRVRWDERHESIVYPADGVVITPRTSRAPARSKRDVRA
jgi:hypothetical protein